MLNAIIPELVFHLENNTLCSKIRKAISCPTMGGYKFIKKMHLYWLLNKVNEHLTS